MWRVILIDDEEFVRAELVALFPWNQYQFELVAETESAQAAIRLMDQVKPDLVITDIRMPEMDGLAFISWLGQHYPQLLVAVVSAYNDFPYVREALRLGAADYLIKAEATLETAGTFLERIGGMLDQRYLAWHKQEELAGNISLYHSLAVESFWRDVFTRASDEGEITIRARQLGIVLDPMWFGLIYIHVSQYSGGRGDHQQEQRLRLETEVREIWNWDWSWEMIDFKRGDFIVVACYAGGTPPVLQENDKLQEIARRLALNDMEKRTTSASAKLCLFSDLPGNFRETRSVNLLRLYHLEGCYIKTDDLLRLRRAAPPEIPKLLANWEQILRELQVETGTDFLNYLFTRIIPQSLEPEEARWMMLDLVNILRRVSFEHQVRWEEIGGRETDLPEILEQAESIHDWQMRIEKMLARYLQSAKESLYPQTSLTLRKALIFIQSNFTRDLSLEEVANYAGVSKSYLSRVFPEYTGEHFSDYLQRLRIERAKELLRFTNDYIYEIAPKVGFWNSRYFSRVFHENTGLTPADYRRIPQQPMADKIGNSKIAESES